MSIKKSIVVTTGILVLAGVAFALARSSQLFRPVTFNDQIAPIIYSRCSNCHRKGQIGPFAFTSYEEVIEHAQLIRDVTLSGVMPPWRADPEFRHFRNENVLSDEERELIRRWVDAGAPQGDPALEKRLHEYLPPTETRQPDMVLKMSETFTRPADNQEYYKVFVLPINSDTDLEISGLEIVAGNPQILHHAWLYLDEKGTGRERDALDSEYGFDLFIEGMPDLNILPVVKGYLPGKRAEFYPPGVGLKIPAGADLLLETHYVGGNSEQLDQSQVNLYFAEQPIEREVFYLPVTEADIQNPPFVIPAGEKASFLMKRKLDLPHDLSLLSFSPHMHYRGTHFQAAATLPSGETANLVKIDNWDFNWQFTYELDQPLRLPQGTEIVVNTTYDNTAENPFNPIVPPVTTRYGYRSVDEMSQFWMEVTRYDPADEK